MELEIRSTKREDGAEIWDLVRRTGTLDLNSEYCYFMFADLFSKQCAVITSLQTNEILGFVSCIIKGEREKTLFVWQVCTDKRVQKKGLAKKLIQFVINTQSEKISFIETTISESNLASKNLFKSLAEYYTTKIEKSTYIASKQFKNGHEAEYLYKIGKLNY